MLRYIRSIEVSQYLTQSIAEPGSGLRRRLLNAVTRSADRVRLYRRTVGIIFFLLVALAALIPRAPALDRFMTVDEWDWFGFSASFYRSLYQRDFAGTYQHGNLGASVMWAGTLAYLWRYPQLVSEARPHKFADYHLLEIFFKEHDTSPILIMQSARLIMVLWTAIALGLAFLAVRRLFGLLPALLGLMLITFDPFHIGLTRLHHPDGFMSSLMLLAAVSFLAYTYCGRGWFDLALATLATGFAWLTKIPSLYLVLFFGLVALVQVWYGRRENGRLYWHIFWRSTWPVLFVLVGAVLVFFLFWPAMWVDPLGTLQKVISTTADYALEGHNKVVFFMGRVITGDPGWLFYPVNYLWRTTPGVLAGLALALLAFFKRWSPLEEKRRREIAVLLVLDALLFAVMMSLGAKKFDRYIIPSFPPLDLVAGIGWAALLGWVWGRPKQPAARWAAVGLGVLVIGSQVFLAGRTYPYYLTYYNPLLGGSAKAPEVMMIGWGEGLDQAARYINQEPGAENLTVMSYYQDGSFSFFFDGKTLGQPKHWQGGEALQAEGVDYVVLYANQWQRQLPDQAMLNYFAAQTPEYIVSLDSLEYARVYKIGN
jgi:Dolichyl-phosphate-mannose-protein mannosyltransferase